MTRLPRTSPGTLQALRAFPEVLSPQPDSADAGPSGAGRWWEVRVHPLLGPLHVKWQPRPRGLRRITAAIRPAPCVNEYDLLCALARVDIPAPEPIAAVEFPHGGLLLTKNIPRARPLAEVLTEASRTLPRTLLPALGNLLRQMHRAGFAHADLHAGNILVDESGHLRVADVRGGRFLPWMSPELRRADAASMAFSLSLRCRRTDLLRFLAVLDPIELGPGSLGRRRVLAEVRTRRWRHLLSRARRAIEGGSAFDVTPTPSGGRLIVPRQVSPERMREVLSAAGQVVKDLPRGKVTRVPIQAAAPAVYLKELRPRRRMEALLWRAGAAPGRAAWVMLHALRIAGVGTPPPLFFLEQLRPYRTVLGTEEIPEALPADEYVRRRGREAPNERRWRDDLGEALAALAWQLHRDGFDQRDFKANNVLLDARGPGLPKTYLLDLERVRLRPGLSRERRLCHLAQMNAALPPPFSATDRLRSLRAYARRDPSFRPTVELARDLMEQTRARRHNWPPGSSVAAGTT